MASRAETLPMIPRYSLTVPSRRSSVAVVVRRLQGRRYETASQVAVNILSAALGWAHEAFERFLRSDCVSGGRDQFSPW